MVEFTKMGIDHWFLVTRKSHEIKQRTQNFSILIIIDNQLVSQKKLNIYNYYKYIITVSRNNGYHFVAIIFYLSSELILAILPKVWHFA